jgi:L-amino acid N-acyltransferase YncA
MSQREKSRPPDKDPSMIRPVRLTDAQEISRIYNEYVLTTRITFEEEPVTPSEMRARIEAGGTLYPWLIVEEGGKTVGYSYARKWRDRAAYRHSVETGTYLDPGAVGKGFGTQLRKALLDELRVRSFHAVIAGIALPNPASIALCQRFGFTKVAHFREVGFKFGQWIDVEYWELVLSASE